jgi:hypothetical protein
LLAGPSHNYAVRGVNAAALPASRRTSARPVIESLLVRSIKRFVLSLDLMLLPAAQVGLRAACCQAQNKLVNRIRKLGYHIAIRAAA